MSNQVDYNFWANQTTWSVKEALNILTNFYMSLCNGDDEDLGFIRSKRRGFYWAKVSNDIAVFAVDPNNIEWEDVTSNAYIINEQGELITRVDEIVNFVNVKQFIRWAYSEGFKLPDELLCVLNSNGEYVTGRVIEKEKINKPKDLVDPARTTAVIVGVSEPVFRFERIDSGWNIQFDDVVLVGVKDWLGMTYIKMLLGSPGAKIGVLDLQQLARESDEVGPQNYEQGDCGDEDSGNTSCGGVDAWETLDSTAKGNCRNRLEVIAAEIKDARNAGNQTKIAALIKEAEFIKKELNQSSFKPKDPLIEKNRKRVTKAITDTIKNIGRLERICNYNEKPISAHLSRYIKTGSYCSYTADGDKLPDWSF